jgi:2-dehydro-3-deoxyphosphogluconate aldolase/(4S)-4-hydroxy-2-oxoglutarate aldolase
MSRKIILQKIFSESVIAVIRINESKKLPKIAEAIYKGGISHIEITMTTPNALRLIEELGNSMGDFIKVGVGSVLNSETACAAINAGARFVVSPIFKPEIIQSVHKHDIPAIPGAFSPTEILQAHEQGADVVKVFPADVLSMDFIKAIKAPIPDLKLMPTGGVTLNNAGDWIKAGACAVAIGSALLDKNAIAEEKYNVLTENAKILCESIAKGRE